MATFWSPKVNWDISKSGAWGDSFGAFNALVSALGFFAVLMTLFVQSKSIRDQADDIHRQRFDITYFELIRLLSEAREKIVFRHSDEYEFRPASGRVQSALHQYQPVNSDGIGANKIEYKGHDAIREAVRELRFWLGPKRYSLLGKSGFCKIYEDRIHKDYEVGLAPYFRLIYTILNRLREDSVLTDREKARYGNLLRSQLSSDEVSLLAVNALSPVAKDLNELLDQFRMLKYIPESSLQRRLKAVYGERAFKSRD